MNLKLEVNTKTLVERQPIPGMRLPPPIDENWWLWRVAVSENQAIVAFPKFGSIGCGFQKEEDWNTNLPISEAAEDIYEHIKHNKGDDTIPKARCIKAIEMIQEVVAKHFPRQAARN